MVKKKSFAKYTKDQLIEIAERQYTQIQKYKEDEAFYEKQLKIRERTIEKLKKEKEELLEIDKNADAYANYKQLKTIDLQMREYKKLYEKQREVNQENMKKYQEKLAEKQIIRKNERGAGRKLKVDEEKARKIISENQDKSLRKIEKLLIEAGVKISIMTIRRIKKDFVSN